jgi:hypothetical protein
MYGLEKVYDADGKDAKCCQSGLGSTYDDCKCLPCGMTCDSTLSAQQQAFEQYKALNYTEADARAAAETYICADSIFWPIDIPTNVEPVFKCCESVTDDHKCNCPPKDDTKKCYSKWSNPSLYLCDFGKSASGEYCCLENGECKPDEGSVEGYTDWAGCWGSSQDECEEKASKTRKVDGISQTSGCVFDVTPTQKYCGLEVTGDDQCQDARPNFIDNNCGLSAVSDTEWFVNRRLDAKDGPGKKLQFLAMQAIKGPTLYCGTYWLDHPETTTTKPETTTTKPTVQHAVMV